METVLPKLAAKENYKQAQDGDSFTKIGSKTTKHAARARYASTAREFFEILNSKSLQK
jgi:hypothetical protein